ncbi:hypothetical protein Ancab_038990 [Ancistrocladus abbreviatus]
MISLEMHPHNQSDAAGFILIFDTTVDQSYTVATRCFRSSHFLIGFAQFQPISEANTKHVLTAKCRILLQSCGFQQVG